MSKPVRQGDILIMPLTDPFARLKQKETENGKLIVAYGEATGHHHHLTGDAKVFEDTDGTLYIDVGEHGAQFRHDEHGPIPLEQGRYKVHRQREEVLTAGPPRQRYVYD